MVTVPLSGLEHHTMIVGQSGSGKSNFLTRLVEEILTKTEARLIIIDPNGDYTRISDVGNDNWVKSKSAYSDTESLSLPSHIALDKRHSFEKAWTSRRFQFVGINDRLPSTPRASRNRLVLHWKSLQEEQDFVLRLFDGNSGDASRLHIGLNAARVQVQKEQSEAHYDLDTLKSMAEQFRSRDVLLQEFSDAKGLAYEDWSNVIGRFDQVRRNFSIWDEVQSDTGGADDYDLVYYLGQAFKGGTSSRAWHACVIDVYKRQGGDNSTGRRPNRPKAKWTTPIALATSITVVWFFA